MSNFAEREAARARLAPLLVAELEFLRRVARSVVRNADRADDLVQDTVERALRHADLYRPETNIRAWLATILRNLAVSGMRRDAVRARHHADGADIETVAAPARQSDLVELRQTLRLVQGLAPAEREAIRLLGMQEMSHEQAARQVGQAVGTMKSRLSRGRARLRRLAGVEEAAAGAA